MRIKKTSQYIEGGAGLPSYFTTETNTGMKWIDGKDIYRKVIVFTTSSSAVSSWTTFATITNMDRPVHIYGYLEYNANTSSIIPTYESSSGYLLFSTTSGNLQYQCAGYLNKKCNVIVEYTKN